MESPRPKPLIYPVDRGWVAIDIARRSLVSVSDLQPTQRSRLIGDLLSISPGETESSASALLERLTD